MKQKSGWKRITLLRKTSFNGNPEVKGSLNHQGLLPARRQCRRNTKFGRFRSSRVVTTHHWESISGKVK
jgi:hypothetical protein